MRYQLVELGVRVFDESGIFAKLGCGLPDYGEYLHRDTVTLIGVFSFTESNCSIHWLCTTVLVVLIAINMLYRLQEKLLDV